MAAPHHRGNSLHRNSLDTSTHLRLRHTLRPNRSHPRRFNRRSSSRLKRCLLPPLCHRPQGEPPAAFPRRRGPTPPTACLRRPGEGNRGEANGGGGPPPPLPAPRGAAIIILLCFVTNSCQQCKLCNCKLDILNITVNNRYEQPDL
uniref:Uncharacterized protein n=1 Tax=Heterosigma akashiwo TaxID=2829 RepID=A0A7S3Y545_HETAK